MHGNSPEVNSQGLSENREILQGPPTISLGLRFTVLSYVGAISNSVHKLRPILEDGVKFKTVFLAQFSSINPVQAATFKLNRLHHTGTISEFSARFRELASQTDWNDPSKISFYYSKLQDRIKDTIAQAASAPDSYEDYVNC
ncbi:hypothetical protein FRB95_002090, partial [Tulasnella sp. JGI-2019a]